MKRIRTADGGLLFLDEEDYMPKLVAYLRETAGNDAADLVEELMEEEREHYREAIGHAENGRVDMLNRVANLEAILNDERDSHIDEITELEEELERVAERNEALTAVNEYLTDLLNNPEKLFPEIGTSVWRERKGKAREYGRIDAYKLRMHGSQPTFFLRATFRTVYGWADSVWYKLSNIGKTIHICAEDDET